MPTKSDPRTRPTVGMTLETTARWDVARERWRTWLTIYITSSTAEVMNGAFADSGFLLFSVRSEGDSSSWKAFSTERRKKNVVMMLKGSMRNIEIFLWRLLLVRYDGIVK